MNVLILDIGSSSTRAMIFDEHGTLIASSKRAYSFTLTPPGAATMDADSLRAVVEASLDDLQAFAADIDGVGIDTFVGNVLGVDRDGNAITPIYTYADTRSAADVILLRDRIDVRAMHERTGVVHHTAYLPARLHWLRRTEPDLFARVDQWIDFGTYLYRQWFNDHSVPMSYSAASWSGMLNRATLTWEASWLALLDLPKSSLPLLADYSTPQRGLAEKFALRWHMRRDLPFYLAVGDGAAANIGSGCVDSSQIALTLGTTAALRVVTESRLPVVSFGLWSYRVDAQRHLIGGATSEGGNIFQWARATLRLDMSPELNRELASRPADAHGLTFLPLLAGERSPGWAANATGAVIGLRLSSTPLDILHAAMEGVALRLATIADQLQAPDAPVVGSGGALSPLWAQMLADALNRPVNVLAAETAITAWGTAILVFEALGRAVAPTTLNRSVLYLPNPDNAARLQIAKQRQHELYRLLNA